MTTVSLNAALSGLKAAQQALNTVSNNIANASTPGYTRKILPQETLVVAGTGMGVQTKGLIRSVDMALLRDLAKQTGIVQAAGVREAYLGRVQEFHGASEASTSLSARIASLANSFTQLSASPESAILLNNTVSAAQQAAKSFNDFSRLITDLRNQTQEEADGQVAEINASLERIAELNIRISSLTAAGQSTADLEDLRDSAVRTISQYMEVSTYSNGNNLLTVSTRQGQILADTTARELVFDKNTLTASTFYPGGGTGGLYIGSVSGIEITPANVGGSLGALFEMRDQTLPEYQAQIDEMAQKMAQRFDSMGLRLFTDSTGQVPANVAPPAPVGYTGFAGEIQVNRAIVNDPTLLRSGTYGGIVPEGSNEVIRKISEFAFGPYSHEQAAGTTDISAGTLFASLGIGPSAQMVGNVDITDYAPDLGAAPNMTLPASFDLTIGGTTQTIAINPGDTATDLVNTINTAFTAGTAQLSGTGLLVLNGDDDISIADAGIGPAISDLGLSFTTATAVDPAFTVQIGTQSPVTVNISAGDTAADLLLTLNNIPGLTATLGTGGELVLTPTRGGDIEISNASGIPLTALGMTVSSVAHTPFRQSGLGPGGDLSTGLPGNSGLSDFARSIIASHAEDHARAKSSLSSEESYLATLDARNNDTSGVDIDTELAELIRLQTAYSAAARMISATERLFDELLSAV